MPRQQNDSPNAQQSMSSIKKLGSNIYIIFCGNKDMDPTVNRLLVFNTYMQVKVVFIETAEIVRIMILYTLFKQTNNNQNDAIQSVLSGLIFAVCMVPRVNSKHYLLLLTFISMILLVLAAAACTSILIQNYYTFIGQCDLIQKYSIRNPSFEWKAESVCANVTRLYQIYYATDGVIIVLRIVFLYLNYKAYKAVKHQFDQLEKKKRRAEKFDQKQKNKSLYDPNRKI